jgi:hypothetical protein
MNNAQARPGFWRGLLDAVGEDAGAARDWFVRNMQRASGGGILGEGETDSSARAGSGMALGALGMTGAAPGGIFAAPRGAALGAGPIRAYHGSPHDFDRFDISKIGTGEGAQAYGHGLYFADQPSVANSYRGSPELKYQRLSGHMTPAEEIVYDLSMQKGADSHNIFQALKARGIPDDQAFDALDKVWPNRGRMYEVNLHVDPERLLDWDALLSRQAAPVQETLKGMSQRAKKSFPGIDPNADPIAGQVHHLYSQHRGGNRQVVAEELRDAGIPGIRYLDQGSRSAGEGSRNYVVFDDKLIEILRKYGLLGPVVGGGLLASQESGAAAP